MKTDKAKEPDPGGSDQQNLGFKNPKTKKLTVRLDWTFVFPIFWIFRQARPEGFGTFLCVELFWVNVPVTLFFFTLRIAWCLSAVGQLYLSLQVDTSCNECNVDSVMSCEIWATQSDQFFSCIRICWLVQGSEAKSFSVRCHQRTRYDFCHRF